MRRLRPALTASVALAALVLVGCSPNQPAANEALGITEERSADPRIPIGPGAELSIESFDLGFRDLTGVAIDGAVTVTLFNSGSAEHNFRIDQAVGDTNKVSAVGGETVTGELLLFGAPGGVIYQYYCDIPTHRAAGMEGELIVWATAEEAAANAPAPDPAPAPAPAPTEEPAADAEATEEPPAEDEAVIGEDPVTEETEEG